MPTIKHTNKACKPAATATHLCLPHAPCPMLLAPFPSFFCLSVLASWLRFLLLLLCWRQTFCLFYYLWLFGCSMCCAAPSAPSPYQPCSCSSFVYGVWRKRLKQNLFSRPKRRSREIRNATKMRLKIKQITTQSEQKMPGGN